MRPTETHAVAGGFDRRGTSRGHLLARVALASLFLLSSFPLGVFWFIALVVLLMVGLPLTMVGIGLPILALAVLVCSLGADTERRRLAALLGTPVSSPHRPLTRGSVLAHVRGRATDRALWRDLLHLLLLLPIGLVELVVVFVLAASAALATYPLWFWMLPDGSGVQWSGVFLADTGSEALLVMLVGCVAAPAAAALGLQLARAHAALGRALLGRTRREDRD